MNNTNYGKKKEKLRKRIKVKLVSNEKYYLKCKSEARYVAQNI